MSRIFPTHVPVTAPQSESRRGLMAFGLLGLGLVTSEVGIAFRQIQPFPVTTGGMLIRARAGSFPHGWEVCVVPHVICRVS